MENTNSPAIDLNNASVTFGVCEVLAGVSLKVEPGASVAITGRSGSGKTTLLSLLMGLLKPSSGTVQVLSEDLTRLSRSKRAMFRAQHIGIVFQHGELLLELTAEENVALPALLADSGGVGAYSRARQLLEELGVDPSVPTSVLSGGERQRVALARALINTPEIILADEPTGSLDSELKEQAADLLFALPARHGCALVVVTHDSTIAARADRHLTLTDGKL